MGKIDPEMFNDFMNADLPSMTSAMDVVREAFRHVHALEDFALREYFAENESRYAGRPPSDVSEADLEHFRGWRACWLKEKLGITDTKERL